MARLEFGSTWVGQGQRRLGLVMRLNCLFPSKYARRVAVVLAGGGLLAMLGGYSLASQVQSKA